MLLCMALGRYFLIKSFLPLLSHLFLFCRPASRLTLDNETVDAARAYFLSIIGENSVLPHAAAIVPVLTLVCGEKDYALPLFAVKTLHYLFLQARGTCAFAGCDTYVLLF